MIIFGKHPKLTLGGNWVNPQSGPSAADTDQGMSALSGAPRKPQSPARSSTSSPRCLYDGGASGSSDRSHIGGSAPGLVPGSGEIR